MADNITLNAGTGGAVVATDEVSGAHYQWVKVAWGADGTATPATTAAGLPVQFAAGSSVAVSAVSGTVTVSATNLDIRDLSSASDSVAAVQSGTWTVTGTGGTFPVTDSGGSLTVDAAVSSPVFVRLSDGSSAIATLPVSLASVPSHAVTNAGTFAVQAEQSGSWSVDVSALPAGSLAGATAKTADYDTGGGTDTVPMLGIALPGSGGAVAGGTAANPVRIDPTGSTTQPVSLASVPLPTGAATEAKQDTLIGHVDGVEALLGTIDADTSSLAGCVGGTEVQVDIVGSLPAGTNAIGKLAANDGVDIGDVTINNASLAVTGTFWQATQPVSIASTVTVTGAGGTFPVTDSGGSLTVDAAVTSPVFVRLSDGAAAISTLPVSLASVPSHDVTNAGTFAVQAAQSGSWTVTANAGTDLNTSALALESGGNLAGAATSLAVMDDWDETDRCKVNPIVGQAGVAAGAGAVGTTTQRMTLASDDPAVALLGTIDADTSLLSGCVSASQVAVNTELPAAAALADGASNPTTPLVGACGHVWNGSTWDRVEGTTELTLLSSAARTANTASSDQTNHSSRGVLIMLNITVASGTGGLSMNIQGKDSISGAYFRINPAPAAITATGLYVYEVYPGSSTAGSAGASLVNQRTAAVMPRTWRINVGHGDSSSYTYSVACCLIP